MRSRTDRSRTSAREERRSLEGRALDARRSRLRAAWPAMSVGIVQCSIRCSAPDTSDREAATLADGHDVRHRDAGPQRVQVEVAQDAVAQVQALTLQPAGAGDRAHRLDDDVGRQARAVVEDDLGGARVGRPRPRRRPVPGGSATPCSSCRRRISVADDRPTCRSSGTANGSTTVTEQPRVDGGRRHLAADEPGADDDHPRAGPELLVQGVGVLGGADRVPPARRRR